MASAKALLASSLGHWVCLVLAWQQHQLGSTKCLMYVSVTQFIAHDWWQCILLWYQATAKHSMWFEKFQHEQ